MGKLSATLESINSGNGGDLPEILVPGHQPRANPTYRPFRAELSPANYISSSLHKEELTTPDIKTYHNTV